ncbi:hypothetical protein AB0C88_39405 [Streptomyces chartreusis]|uniref:hypothetical protein n=1 Tax=Streptomyces chartreusis TaxID=1969 RepID=UPI0033C59C9D
MALTLWTHLFSLVGFEVFGRLNTMIRAREEYFDHQARVMADLAGLTTPGKDVHQPSRDRNSHASPPARGSWSPVFAPGGITTR